MLLNSQSYYRKLTIIVLVFAVILLLLLTLLYFKNEKALLEKEKYRDLRSIGKLKATQVADWYKQRRRDALYLSQRKQLPDDIYNFDYNGKFNRAVMLNFLEPVISENQYDDIILVSTKGQIIFSLLGEIVLDSMTINTLPKVLESGSFLINDLYYCPEHKKIHHDVLAPIIDNNVIIAILILRSDPDRFLYPYIQEWPVPSETAETIIVMKRGDSAVFLNQMKKVPNTALKYKIPLSDTMVPAVKAVLGGKGLFKGYDYVNEKVLSDIGIIEGTPWCIVVKIDNSELLKELYSKTIIFIIMALLTISIISGAIIFIYYKRQTINQRIKDIADHQLFAEELKLMVAERTRELERSNQDLLSFAHVASHDLREPVRKIKTFVSVLKKECALEDTIKRFLGRIDVAAGRLEMIIDGIHQYTELQNRELSLGDVDLNEIINNVISELDVEGDSKIASFEICPMPKIEGSSIMLYQLFYNLISNSLKFKKPDTQLKISICFQNIQKNNIDFVEITIRDNGIGFEPEYSHTIFEIFKRLHSKDIYEGSGLGLALSKRIVQKHNGTINASSNPGLGAQFNLILPVKQNIS